MYVCNALDEVSNACMEWVVLPDSGLASFSQADAQLIGGWLITFFGMCCAYLIITKAIKLA